MQTTLDMQIILPPQASLSRDLERLRLEHRADRIGATVRALRDRQRLYAETDAPRPALNAAIGDFHAELRRVRVRLSALRASG